MSVLNAAIADESDPPPPRFQSWQEAWQCNDIRETVTAPELAVLEYDIGGTIWGGSRFTRVRGALLFNVFRRAIRTVEQPSYHKLFITTYEIVRG